MANVKILIDFWNFQLSWNEHFPFDRAKGEGPTRIDWKGLPATLWSAPLMVDSFRRRF
jgi:hypothetical protein